MKFLQYLNVSQETLDSYRDQRLVNVGYHKEFPLAIYTYGRKAMHDHIWDNVTRKCRGIVVNTETGDIVARPFEKFFNLGTANMPETDSANFPSRKPLVFEKVDGFLCTRYVWQGKSYIASKGSFTSVHAKWATAWYKEYVNDVWPLGYTPVFEGVTKNLRIVVDYKGFEGLVLLALINNESGEEVPYESLKYWGESNNVRVVEKLTTTWQDAVKDTLKPTQNVEGYVLTWQNVNEPPFRVKVKYLEYLRLHRMVTGVSPKHIYDVLAGNSWSGEMDEYLNNSTPWFNKFVTQWKTALEGKYKELALRTDEVFQDVRKKLGVPPYGSAFPTRKDWAVEFTKPENKELSGALFGMLDGKDVRPILWKLTKPLIANGHPLVSLMV
jgi:hypothetical protein